MISLIIGCILRGGWEETRTHLIALSYYASITKGPTYASLNSFLLLELLFKLCMNQLGGQLDTRKAGLILLHYLSFPTNAKQLSFPRELLYVLSLHSPSDISIELETFLCGRLMMVVSNSLKVPKGYSYKLLCSQSPLCFLQPICLYEIKFYFHFPPKVYSIYQYFSLPNLAFFTSPSLITSFPILVPIQPV